MCLAAVNAFTTNAWLGQSIPAETTALSAHRKSSPSCLTLFWQPPSNTSTFPSISTRLLPILHSTLSVSLTTYHVPFSPSVVPGPPDFGPLNDRRMERSPIHPSAQGSSSDWVLQVVHVHARHLLCPQSRVLSVPPLLQSCLTGPLDALSVSAFPVNSLSLTTVSVSHLSPLFHRRLLLPPTVTRRLTASRTVLCRCFHDSTVGGVVSPLLPDLALSLGSSLL